MTISSDPSGWTFSTMIYHIEKLFAAQNSHQEIQDRRYSERQEASDKAIAAALNAAATAVSKAETAAEKRFESVNEFRALVNDLLSAQKAEMMPRKEVMLLFDGVKGQYAELSGQIAALTRTVTTASTASAGEKAGKVDTWKDIGLIISLVLAVLAVASRFLP